MRVSICGCMSHDNIDIFEGISIPSRAFWFILESSLKRNGDEDYKIPEAFITWKLFLVYKIHLSNHHFHIQFPCRRVRVVGWGFLEEWWQEVGEVEGLGGDEWWMNGGLGAGDAVRKGGIMLKKGKQGA